MNAVNAVNCSGVIHQYLAQDLFFIQGNDSSLIQITNALIQNEDWITFWQVAPILIPNCFPFAARSLCSAIFPPCFTNASNSSSFFEKGLCSETCLGFNENCNTSSSNPLIEIILQNITSFLPICSTLSSSSPSCFFPTLPYFNQSEVECPLPMVQGDGIERDNCPGAICCVPCPVPYQFYPQSTNFDQINLGLISFATISSFLCLLVTIVHSSMPSKRIFPQSGLIFLGFSLFVSYLALCFPIFFGSFKDVVCVSEIEESTGENSTWKCNFQGFLWMFGFSSSSLWFAILNFNSFLFVYGFESKWYFEIIYHVLSWGISLLPAIIGISLKLFYHNFAFVCSAKNQIELTVFSFCFVCLACCLIFICLVFLKVIRVAIQTKRSVFAILGNQFRFLLVSTYSLLSVVVYVLYDRLYQSPYGPLESFPSWLICVAQGNGQDQCSELVSDQRSPIAWYLIGYIFILVLGFVFSLTFLLKRDVLEHVRLYFLIQGCARWSFSLLRSKASEPTNSTLDLKTLN